MKTHLELLDDIEQALGLSLCGSAPDHGNAYEAIDKLRAALSSAAAPEPEWEYRIDRGETIRYTRAKSEAVRASMKGRDVRRRRPKVERPAGPWEPLPVGGETDGES